MATGEFAEPIYTLLDELGIGADEAVLVALIAYLSSDSIRDFVEHFRRHNSMPGFEDFHLCLDCQESYDIDKPHVCSDEKTELIDWNDNSDNEVIFFSSLIPEC